MQTVTTIAVYVLCEWCQNTYIHQHHSVGQRSAVAPSSSSGAWELVGLSAQKQWLMKWREGTLYREGGCLDKWLTHSATDTRRNAGWPYPNNSISRGWTHSPELTFCQNVEEKKSLSRNSNNAKLCSMLISLKCDCGWFERKNTKNKLSFTWPAPHLCLRLQATTTITNIAQKSQSKLSALELHRG